MREIKFKAWNKIHKFMGRVYELFFDSGIVKVLRMGRSSTHTFGLKDVELLQFTGLKDKNGQEIYEGDIFRYIQDIYRVYWDKCCFWAERQYDKTPFRLSNVVIENENLIDSQIELIGNRFENPELKGE